LLVGTAIASEPLGFLTLCSAKTGKHGKLGAGSEDLDDEATATKLKEYRAQFVKDGHPLMKHGRELACSACRLAADRFQNKVARKIKGKMSEEQKLQAFSTAVQGVCDRGGFPVQSAVVEKGGREMYVDFQDAMSNHHGKVSVKRMSPEIVDDLVAACRHLTTGPFEEALRKKVLLTPKGGRASDTDFRSWLCGPRRAGVCDEDPEDDEDEDDGKRTDL